MSDAPVFIGPPFCARCNAEGAPLQKHGRVLLCAGCRPAPAFVRAFRRSKSVTSFLEDRRLSDDPLATFRRQKSDPPATRPHGEFATGAPRADLVSRMRSPYTLIRGLARMWRGEDP